MNCFRHLRFMNVASVDSLTLFEYRMLMKAHALQMLDEEYKAHKQAWIDQQVQATKQRGKNSVPVYQKFKQFFDYEKLEKEIMGTQKKETSDLMTRLKRANS